MVIRQEFHTMQLVDVSNESVLSQVVGVEDEAVGFRALLCCVGPARAAWGWPPRQAYLLVAATVSTAAA